MLMRGPTFRRRSDGDSSPSPLPSGGEASQSKIAASGALGVWIQTTISCMAEFNL